MFSDQIAVEGAGEQFNVYTAAAEWEGRSQAGPECTDLYWLPDGRWALSRRRPGAAAAARVVSAEQARAWLDARPCAPLRAACLRAYQVLDLVSDMRHGLTASAERDVRRLWRLMRELVGKGVAPRHPGEPGSLPDLWAARAAVAAALGWCQGLEETCCGECRRGAGFRSVVWFCTPYTFTAGQAACVEVLWGAWERGTPDVSQAHIMEGISDRDQPRLSDLFSRHPAWGG